MLDIVTVSLEDRVINSLTKEKLKSLIYKRIPQGFCVRYRALIFGKWPVHTVVKMNNLLCALFFLLSVESTD